MRFTTKEKTSLYEQILAGLSCLALVFALNPSIFNEWLVEEYLEKAVSIFFIVPIAYSIIRFKYPKEIIVVAIIGGILFGIYAMVFSTSLKEGALLLLQTVAEITLITASIYYIKKVLDESVPP